jgi:hypothetical protein
VTRYTLIFRTMILRTLIFRTLILRTLISEAPICPLRTFVPILLRRYLRQRDDVKNLQRARRRRYPHPRRARAQQNSRTLRCRSPRRQDVIDQ